MRLLFAALALMLLTACGSGGPPPPDWKSDSADLIERYKKHALLGENTLAERYFQQAIAATGGAGRVSETARLWLVRCATHRASLLDDDCHEYAELAKIETSADDRAYYQFITLDWRTLDPARLPAHYANLVRAEPAALNAKISAISDPLSRLLAASLVVQRRQADDAILLLAAETASSQGWRQPLLVYLKLLEARAEALGNKTEQLNYAARIRLVEDALHLLPANRVEGTVQP